MTGSTTSKEKRLPAVIALIHADHCTGCGACREVCPVGCIHLATTAQRVNGSHAWCEVDLERCFGCRLCVRLPRKRADRYELKICPWDAIEMIPLDFLPQAVAHLEGPAAFMDVARPRLLAAAQRLLSRSVAEATDAAAK